ncbi:hypothetical protein, partial [Salmonella sp. SAL4431]|uniref:hypothetical protein n=1 Tax=Salmonella sp. SAL4431 TaxID=3159886 RepID=UPI00397902E6
ADTDDSHAFHLRLALVAAHTRVGNWAAATEAAETLVASETASGKRISVGWAYLFLGVSAYERNELELAMHYFAVVNRLRHQVHTQAYHA